jgi:hypothetical protein
LIPSGADDASYYGPTASVDIKIFDHWVIGVDSYVFANWLPSTSRMIKTPDINNGTKFPITTATSPNPLVPTTLTGVLAGQVAYEPTTSLFYYINTAGTIYSVSTTGTITSVSAALAGLGLTDIANYGYRLVSWGGTNATAKKRLYYSDTTLANWSTAGYYEFSGTILNVLPRTNDLIVICDTGVFSLVGVLGSSVTNQLIVPQNNIAEGMRNAVVVGRNVYFLDQSLVGSPDGRIYRLTGSNVQAVETITITDVLESQSKGVEQGVIGAVNDGRIVVQLRDGHCYAESTPGTWARFYGGSNNYSSNLPKQTRIGRAGPNSLNEYFLVVSVDPTVEPNDYPGVVLTRYIHNVIDIVDKDNDFQYASTPSISDFPPQGNAILPEYWHSKPFNVKEIFVEFFPRLGGNPQLSAGVQSTGIVDLYTAENGGSYTQSSEPLTVGIANTYLGSVTQRFRSNDAGKGFGTKPFVNFTDVTIKRVILNCED